MVVWLVGWLTVRSSAAENGIDMFIFRLCNLRRHLLHKDRETELELCIGICPSAVGRTLVM